MGLVSALRLAAIIFVSFYLLAALFMYLSQRSYQYFPSHRGMGAAAVGLSGVADLKLVTEDGERLQVWYTAARPGKPTILYLHGNGGEISDRGERFAVYQAQGFGVLFVSYRGYGASTGSPSEIGLVRDARAAYDWLIAQGVRREAIMLVGESLGSGVAVQLAAERTVGAVALEAPFYSAADIAASIYWWLPVRLLMKDKFDSFLHIGKVHAPLLIIHGDQDEIIPLGEGRKLFASANEPKQMTVVPGGTHGTIFSPDTWMSEMQFFAQYSKP
ncbi:alpha/beta fold hydrolase [Nordella sp. HKS 07]|uniref:alpha/beta hydrolase n=1 Tax=Nordella sp. HKS 07 TaxID=2712222 RepID=UPI0013E1E940|nr:alpha/beta fold hydrolase [Nordella sp. HKS 07]QIG50065.1 alpha/beta fold hydrolase [Nordella sp. HKS 07]